MKLYTNICLYILTNTYLSMSIYATTNNYHPHENAKSKLAD